MSRARVARAALWLIAIGLFVWTLSRVSLGEAWAAVRELDATAIGILVALNLLALVVFGLKWWIVLRGLGQPIGLGHTSLYRLAGFGFAYFTPGPRVGGEPLQVVLAEKRHGTPRDVAIASVALDRLLDAVVNLAFLVAAAFFLVDGSAWFFVLVVVVLPLVYLLALARGYTPLAKLIPRDVVRSSEAKAGRFCREHKAHLALAVLFSFASLAIILVEYWLVAYYLGTRMSPVQLVAGIAAARIAYYLFLPAALGVLEAGQVMVLDSMGLPASLGISLSLVMRFRDVVVASVGLWMGLKMLTGDRARKRDAPRSRSWTAPT